ncbi:hypothetical protein HPB50_027136 [Hyalomma asiaticum]|uniref:Uncharacterized protein n=1 Tax=Hyalomma asiaticum TaxID=266040 RepID=A0ACB7T6S9_HYAAI|nr:hypothetical protein HPB50_027136 [Hyalomma asiaticum]
MKDAYEGLDSKHCSPGTSWDREHLCPIYWNNNVYSGLDMSSRQAPKGLDKAVKAVVGAVYLDYDLDVGLAWSTVEVLLGDHMQYEIAAAALRYGAN